MPKQLTADQDATAMALVKRRRNGEQLNYNERNIVKIYEKKKYGNAAKKK